MRKIGRSVAPSAGRKTGIKVDSRRNASNHSNGNSASSNHTEVSRTETESGAIGEGSI